MLCPTGLRLQTYQLITSHQKQKFTNFTKFHTVPAQFTQDGALRNCKAVTTLTIQVASIIIATSSNKSQGTIITISRKKRNVKSMNTKETNTGCVIKYTLTTTHQCAKQVYRCVTKQSPRKKSSVQTRINRPLIAAYLQSINAQNNYPFAMENPVTHVRE